MKVELQKKARDMRKDGHSLKEIASVLKVSKSSASVWVKSVILSPQADAVLKSKSTAGQLASQQTIRRQTLQKENDALMSARKVLSSYHLTPDIMRVILAMIFHCEGSKNTSYGVQFTNSDPNLIRTFMQLLRATFEINEEKLRAGIHLHDYHNPERQLKFWSKVARIPTHQFIKPYRKQNSGLYKKENYQGCVSIRYYDVKVARELKALALEFMNRGL